MATPYVAIHLTRVGSTQTLARAEFDGVPVLVTAAEQTAGRGRHGRQWVTADRAVAASMAWRPSWPSDRWSLFPLVAGVAAVAAIGGGLRLKWPNDVIDDAGKVAGILVEGDPATGVVVAGIGVNLWWPEPVAGASALQPEDPGAEVGPEIAERWAEEMLARTERDAWDLADYLRLCATVGTDITWSGGRGRAVGVAADGGLEVDGPGGREILTSGEVHTVRREGPGGGGELA